MLLRRQSEAIKEEEKMDYQYCFFAALLIVTVAMLMLAHDHFALKEKVKQLDGELGTLKNRMDA